MTHFSTPDNCIGCAVALTDKNWSARARRSHHKRCYTCQRAHEHAAYATKQVEILAYQQKRYEQIKAGTWIPKAQRLPRSVICRRCQAALTDSNWLPGSRRANNKVCTPCDRKYQLEHYYKHQDRRCAEVRARSALIRAELLNAYGNVCKCCGEAEEAFLTVDHVHNDGKEHRKALGGSGGAFYRWLRDRDYPQDGFQLLCWNCNHAKYSEGICPHTTKRLNEANEKKDA